MVERMRKESVSYVDGYTDTEIYDQEEAKKEVDKENTEIFVEKESLIYEKRELRRRKKELRNLLKYLDEKEEELERRIVRKNKNYSHGGGGRQDKVRAKAFKVERKRKDSQVDLG